MEETLGLVALLTLCAVAAFVDARTGRIPNGWILFGLAMGLGVRLHVGLALDAAPAEVLRQLALGVAGLLVCGLLPLLVWRVGGLGGGDVKLLATVGWIAGPRMGLETLCCAMSAAAVAGLVLASARGRLADHLSRSARVAGHLWRSPGATVAAERPRLTALRFGPAALCGAGLVAWLHLAAGSGLDAPSPDSGPRVWLQAGEGAR